MRKIDPKFPENEIDQGVPTIWKWQGNKWSDPIELPHEDGIEFGGAMGLGGVFGMNGAGNIVAGISTTAFGKDPSDINNIGSVATVWTEKGNTWTRAVLPGTIFDSSNLDNLSSTANAVNNIGNIIVGMANKKPVLWKFDGNNWSNQFLPLVDDSDKGEGEAFALNNKGDVVGGRVKIEIEYPADPPELADPEEPDDIPYIPHKQIVEVPVIWSGKDLTPTILKDHKNSIAKGQVNALSANGKIAGGNVDVMQSEEDIKGRATLWAGKEWKAYDLGTFTKNGLGESSVRAMNDDGTIVGGEAQFDDGKVYAALWHIQYNKDGEVEGKTIITDKTDISTIKITPINVDFTGKALKEMGSSSMALLGEQYHGLKRLQKSCYTKEQGFCYRTYGDWSKSESAKDLNAGLSLGYQFGNGILVGATLDHSLNRSFATNYKHSDSNLGLGLFARFDHANWYVSPSIAWNYYDAKVKRNPYAFTESEEQKAKVKGFALALTAGQDFQLANKATLGWYGKLSTTKVTRSAFAEKNLALPFSYAEMKLQETALALGAKLEFPITEKLKALVNAEVEQQLSGNTPVFTASGKITNFSEKYKINRTRARLQAGVAYQFNPSLELSVMPYVEKGIYGNKRYGAEVNLSGRF